MNHHPHNSASPSSHTSRSAGKLTGWGRWGGLALVSAVAVPLLAACGGSADGAEMTPVTTTVTSTVTTTDRPKTTTVTTTVTAEPETTTEAPVEPVDPPVDMDANVAPAAVADVDAPRGFAAIPEPAPAPAPAPAATFYQNCSAVRAAGAAPLYAGSPGYSSKLDRDGDGVACE